MKTSDLNFSLWPNGQKSFFKMRISHDQQEFCRLMNLYLDNELSNEDENKLLQELRSNPSYMQFLSQEKSFREFIKSRVQRRKVSPALIDSIKEKIRIAPA
jgi:hypothetical protein